MVWIGTIMGWSGLVQYWDGWIGTIMDGLDWYNNGMVWIGYNNGMVWIGTIMGWLDWYNNGMAGLVQ